MPFAKDAPETIERMRAPGKGVFVALILLGVTAAGCTSAGSFLAANVTNVELGDSGFEIVARDVQGSAHADYIIGLSTSTGAVSSTFALARVGGTPFLYNDALTSLWASFEESYGPVEGKNLVLANVRYDTDILNLLVFTRTTLYVHADVVELEGE